MTRIPDVALLAMVAGELLVAVPSRVSAQEPAADSAKVQAHMAALRSDLRNFLVAQERYFADHTTYAVSTPQLTEHFTPSPGVTVVLLAAGGTGWNAVAIHESAPGLRCAIWVGATPSPPLNDGADEGEPTCAGVPVQAADVCSQPGPRYNEDGSCFDAAPRANRSAIVRAPPGTQRPRHHPIVWVRVAADGTVTDVQRDQDSDVPRCMIYALRFAADSLQYTPARKGASNVDGWLQLQVRCLVSR